MTERTDTPAPGKSHAEPADDDMEKERLEPGLRTAGAGGVGATPGQRKGHDNSNT